MTISITPTLRDIKFKLPAHNVTHWHKDGMNVSQYLNTMSLFLPVGERFFIKSVRLFRKQITDKELTKAVTAFIGQEAMHGREHEELNKLLEEAGTPANAQEEVVQRLLSFAERVLPAEHQLAVTIGLEHLTGLLADALLNNPESFDGSDERYTTMWRWHAYEETEHKAVAFDVYRDVMGNNLNAYLLRCSYLVAATSIYFALQYPFYIENVRREKGLLDIKGWIKGANFLWGKPGLKRQCISAWFDWFRPGFHPWDHDNRHHLEKFEELLNPILNETSDYQAASVSNG
ncbi:metal-dependent hydrolase [Alkalimarinus sediminis]|uniref:Metal-dependent hydrolase n=1 Tax=Alkalimarinus sediminis TaxID=1632866 RepID=A0A9E8HIB5_9ALTE|nr:metal-dependent hydrolase [Alkalimarinus sediminis]UZW75208.1 metal-dependent hydrolase [Alkalimarinus sediminis]